MSELAVVVCDDSTMARNQMVRVMPKDWPVRVTQASNGLECLKAVSQGLGKLVFLDLTMPEMDGYKVLQAMGRLGLDSQVIVVSGDIQASAQHRVKELGALDFLKKPVTREVLIECLQRHGLYQAQDCSVVPEEGAMSAPVPLRDAMREITNVAMGQAAALLARVLGVFIELPIPSVNLLENTELQMALGDIRSGERLTAVCQGFIGEGMSGEALLMFHDSDFAEIAALLGRQSPNQEARLEMLMDLASILIGACLHGLTEQWGGNFAVGHPMVISEGDALDDIMQANLQRRERTLAIEIGYRLEGRRSQFDLLLLFTEDSMPALAEKISYVVGEVA